MRTKPMVQWAPGTRLSRMRRDDGTYEMEMKALEERVNKVREGVEKKELSYKEGDLVLAGENIEFAGEVDQNGHWVKIRGHKHGSDYCRSIPDWFKDAYAKMIKEVYFGIK